MRILRKLKLSGGRLHVFTPDEDRIIRSLWIDQRATLAEVAAEIGVSKHSASHRIRFLKLKR